MLVCEQLNVCTKTKKDFCVFVFVYNSRVIALRREWDGIFDVSTKHALKRTMEYYRNDDEKVAHTHTHIHT